jgi:hypothetical protein
VARARSTKRRLPGIVAGGQKAGDEVIRRHTKSELVFWKSRYRERDRTRHLAAVRELILAAEKTKLPIMKIVDQYMGFYTPLVPGDCGSCLGIQLTAQLDNVISVIIFSCPCAFILQLRLPWSRHFLARRTPGNTDQKCGGTSNWRRK